MSPSRPSEHDVFVMTPMDVRSTLLKAVDLKIYKGLVTELKK
jgi:hypothetical protein